MTVSILMLLSSNKFYLIMITLISIRS